MPTYQSWSKILLAVALGGAACKPKDQVSATKDDTSQPGKGQPCDEIKNLLQQKLDDRNQRRTQRDANVTAMNDAFAPQDSQGLQNQQAQIALTGEPDDIYVHSIIPELIRKDNRVFDAARDLNLDLIEQRGAYIRSEIVSTQKLIESLRLERPIELKPLLDGIATRRSDLEDVALMHAYLPPNGELGPCAALPVVGAGNSVSGNAPAANTGAANTTAANARTYDPASHVNDPAFEMSVDASFNAGIRTLDYKKNRGLLARASTLDLAYLGIYAKYLDSRFSDADRAGATDMSAELAADVRSISPKSGTPSQQIQILVAVLNDEIQSIQENLAFRTSSTTNDPASAQATIKKDYAAAQTKRQSLIAMLQTAATAAITTNPSQPTPDASGRVQFGNTPATEGSGAPAAPLPSN